MAYTDDGKYRPGEAEIEPDADEGTSSIKRKNEAEGWVEWSATGLKGASLYDLTGHTSEQQRDRLLPLLRCKSRLIELHKSALSRRTTVTFLSVDTP